MIKRLRKAIGVLAILALLAGAGGWTWASSDPADCEVGVDPGVGLANERAGEEAAYSEYCHEHAGNKLHVVEAGEGEIVLFIHGFPTYWYSLIRPMKALRGEYRVVGIDGLGAGYSDAPTEVEHYKLERMAEHLDALIDELGGGPVHLVGHDWGAAFGLAYAQARPEKIKTVTGMSAPPQNIAVHLLETSEVQREKSEYVELLKGASPIAIMLSGGQDRIAGGPNNHAAAGRISEEEADVLNSATSDMRRINRHIHWYRANLPAPDAITEDDYWPSRDARLTTPTLLIWGNDDTVFDASFIEVMEAGSDDLTVLRLDGVGHAPQFEAPEAIIDAISKHLAKDRASGSD